MSTEFAELHLRSYRNLGFAIEKGSSLARSLFSSISLLTRYPQLNPSYFGCCCWSGVALGADIEEPLEASCSRSFLSRLTSTRPPLM